jgi:hypothetical protein
MAVTQTGRDRLAELVKTRRRSLRLTKKQAADAGALAAGTWTRIEAGLSVREHSYAGIDQGIEWVEGSAERVASEQGDPTTLEEMHQSSRDAEAQAAVRRALEQLSGFPVGRGLDAEAEGLTGEQVEAVKVIIRGMRGA